jgi:hypothetical protein
MLRHAIIADDQLPVRGQHMRPQVTWGLVVCLLQLLVPGVEMGPATVMSPVLTAQVTAECALEDKSLSANAPSAALPQVQRAAVAEGTGRHISDSGSCALSAATLYTLATALFMIVVGPVLPSVLLTVISAASHQWL